MPTYIDVVDVGHGGCSVIRDSETTVVVDVASSKPLLYYLERFGIKEIDAVIVTHLDADHCAGLLALLTDREVHVKKVWLNPDFCAWANVAGLRKNCSAPGPCSCRDGSSNKAGQMDPCTLAARVVQRVQQGLNDNPTFARPYFMGDQIRAGTVDIDVLWPEYGITIHPCSLWEALQSSPDRNLMSGAVRGGEVSGTTVMAGDCPMAAIRRSVDSGANWRAEILVYPHHGGNIGDDADHQELAEIVQPKKVVFQISRKKFNLPRPAAVEAFRGAARILCTGLSNGCCKGDEPNDLMCAGGIRFNSDGDTVTQRAGHQEFIERDPQLNPMCKPRVTE
jgi:competence protein ComEC